MANNTTSLASVWNEVEKLLAQEISIIPVRDKDETNAAGETRVAKSPYGNWKKHQTTRITKQELWHQMDSQYSTTAIAIIAGKVSGNLEVIDIDSKYQHGIDAILFSDINNLYPELYKKLRIHRSPSGGYHILYRIAGGTVPGNVKLAGRAATDEELAKKPSEKTKNFLETRGEGGYVLAPPSMGYSVHQDKPIPTITWEERCSLITLCETYNEIVKVAPAYKPTKTEQAYYDENPFENFNNNCDPVALMEEHGWSFFKQNNHFIWFTRPGKKTGVSASFNLSKRVFYIFTGSTELEEARGYNPATILAKLKFNGDNRKTYHHLVEKGFGKVKPSIEREVIKHRVTNNKPLPSNFSEEAKALYQAEAVNLQQAHPYGIFWETDEDHAISIDREGLYEVSHGLGFRTHNGQIVRIGRPFIAKVNDRGYFDALKEYIQETDEDLNKEIKNAYESFLQRSGAFTITRLRELDDHEIIRDTIDTAYKFYKNCFIQITKEGITQMDYETIADNLVWEDKVMKRDWSDEKPESCKYTEYLRLAIGLSDQLSKVVGYLAHDHKDENTGYIITLTELCIDPKNGGGSGKNIFGNLLRHSTTVCTVPGDQVQFNEKFLQSWNDERVLFIPDVPKRFNYAFLKEISTGHGIVKKMYRDERTVAPQDMPKLLINTNFSFDVSDGGLKRRIIPIEFTDFFTRCGGVDAHFGCLFPAGWSTEDWHGFDHYIAEAIIAYFKCNGKLRATELSRTGWEKQFKQTYGGELTYNFLSENMEQWKAQPYITSADFNTEYERYCNENNIGFKFRLGSPLMNKALQEYCDKNEIEVQLNISKKIQGTTTKVKTFSDKLPPAEDELPF